MTDAELAILGLVAEKPCYGFELEQLIEARGMREWTDIGFSSIYFLLNKLEKGGLVEAHLEPAAGRGPARKVYQVTPGGRAALAEGVFSALSTPHRPASGLLSGLGYLPALPAERAKAALEAYHEDLSGQMQRLRERWEAQKPLPYFVDAQFEYTLALLEREAEWITAFQARLGRMSTGESAPDGEGRFPKPDQLS